MCLEANKSQITSGGIRVTDMGKKNKPIPVGQAKSRTQMTQNIHQQPPHSIAFLFPSEAQNWPQAAENKKLHSQELNFPHPRNKD